MGIRYKLVERKDMTAGALEGAKLYYPQLMDNGRVSFDKLCDEVAEQSALTSGDVKNAVDRLVHCIAGHLADGQSVDVGDLGSFRISLRSSGSESAKDYSVNTMMRTPNIVFTPGVKLRKMRKEAKFERFEIKPSGSSEE